MKKEILIKIKEGKMKLEMREMIRIIWNGDIVKEESSFVI